MVATSGLFRASRLQLYGYTVAAIYVLFLVSVYRAGTWILDTKGAPIYTDFACAWAAALQAIHGQVALLYDPAKFVTFTFENTGKDLVFTLTDEGIGVDPAKLPDPRDPENLLRGTGRGIFLIRSMMDEVNFRQLHPGTELTLVKHLAAPAKVS